MSVVTYCRVGRWSAVLMALLLVSPLALAKGPGLGAPQVPEPKVGPTYDWSAQDSLLARYAGTGLVDYAAWKASGTAELDQVLKEASCWALYDSAESIEKLVFLINAYNGFVVRDILEKYPVASVKDIPGFFDTKKHAIAGGEYTLDQIEKKLIKGVASNDPYIHFALVCGGKGCPALRSKSYRAASWPFDTANQTQHFVAEPTKLRFDDKAYILHVSEIFHWYRNDFEVGDLTLPRWIGPHLTLGVAMKMAASEPPVEFLPFDWSLNDVAKGKK
ncbi:MAG: DUF547 domain-containing protein [Candidatus Eisenbacteria bacterium]|nr:DUF547 domain-containing protein [Candidatus Eisenbacteria bacterium]